VTNTLALDQPERDPRLIFETAAQHATMRVPIAAPGQRVDHIREQLTGQRYESASHVIVCDADTFRGVVTAGSRRRTARS
jgi:magnesium transporter